MKNSVKLIAAITATMMLSVGCSSTPAPSNAPESSSAPVSQSSKPTPSSSESSSSQASSSSSEAPSSSAPASSSSEASSSSTSESSSSSQATTGTSQTVGSFTLSEVISTKTKTISAGGAGETVTVYYMPIGSTVTVKTSVAENDVTRIGGLLSMGSTLEDSEWQVVYGETGAATGYTFDVPQSKGSTRQTYYVYLHTVGNEKLYVIGDSSKAATQSTVTGGKDVPVSVPATDGSGTLNCYTIPNVLETKSYPVQGTLPEWYAELENGNVNVYTVKKGTIIDMSGNTAFGLTVVDNQNGTLSISDTPVDYSQVAYSSEYEGETVNMEKGSYFQINYIGTGYFLVYAYPNVPGIDNTKTSRVLHVIE